MHIWYFTIYIMVIIYVSFNTVLGTFAFELYHYIQQQQQQQEGQRTESRHPLQQAPLHFQLHKSYNQELSKPNIIQDTFTPYEKEENLEHPSPFKIILISSISELSLRHFVKPNHIYKLINNTGVIIHASKLSLPLSPPPTHHTSNNWIFIQSPYPPHVSQIHFPISKCLNQQFGDGGSIDVQSTIFASFINTLDLTLGLNILFASESFTLHFELTKSITWRNLYTCIVPDGMIGQMWARSDVVEFDVVNLSFIEFKKDKSSDNYEDEGDDVVEILKKGDRLKKKLRGSKENGVRNKLHYKKNKIKVKLWRKLQKIKMFNGGGGSGGLQRRPIISCVTDVRLLDCSGKRTRDSQGLEII
ncbi:hypothetical protein CORT_0G01000 [Candida orthopsilosis Co 90-125]|uniref:Uncharacterized protein n=1 Tax=Candida orthopsilosis (strain 90-125) TaxID=1136231 RepID=H8X9X1_CANO9|nr:hypothetical protein CORT_0G01000 [Candida orthopsilosis Co 90-125]CCG24788.1 hypothetical protein CORT_0G01000 [Candida orthopsilosis Co 90-125]